MSIERGHGSDRLAIDVGLGFRETGRHSTSFTVEKWDVDQIKFARHKNNRDLLFNPAMEPDAAWFRAMRVGPYEVHHDEDCNLILDAGWQLLMNGLAGSSITKFSATVGRIGGGITNTAAAYTQTDLQAATGAANRQWELVSSTPTVGSTHTAGLVFAATFPTTDGNFAWAEFGVDQGTAGGTGASVATMLSRGVSSPGTKTSAQTWNATVTITWT